MPHVYLPFSQAYNGGIVFLVVETAGDPGSLTEPVRQTLVSSHPDFRTYGVKRLSDALSASFWLVRFEVWVLGIRVAMGAQRADGFRLVIGQGARVTMAGIGAGLI